VVGGSRSNGYNSSVDQLFGVRTGPWAASGPWRVRPNVAAKRRKRWKGRGNEFFGGDTRGGKIPNKKKKKKTTRGRITMRSRRNSLNRPIWQQGGSQAGRQRGFSNKTVKGEKRKEQDGSAHP